MSAISVDPSHTADSFVKLLARRAYNLTGAEVSGRGSRGAESGRRTSAAE